MLKKFGSLLTLSSLLLTTTAFAKNPDLREDSVSRAAAFHHTVSNPRSEESRWWSDYVRSGDEITAHVEHLASTNPQAAMWFLLTGGANGFSKEQATSEQATRLVSAMKRVASSFLSSRSAEGLETWAHVKASLQAGHVHLQMLNRQIEELKKENGELRVEVAGLKAEVKSLKGEVKSLSERLEQEQKERRADSARLEKEQKERLADVKASKEEVRVLLERGMADLQQRIKDGEAHTASMMKDGEVHTASMMKLLADQIKEFSDIFDKKLLATEDRLKNEAAAREATLVAREDKRVAELKAEAAAREAEAKAREERKEAEAKKKESRFLRIIAKRLHAHTGARVPAGRRAAAASEAAVDLRASDASAETLHGLDSVLRGLDGGSAVSGDGDTDSDTASTTS
jgi:cell division protein FtsB